MSHMKFKAFKVCQHSKATSNAANHRLHKLELNNVESPSLSPGGSPLPDPLEEPPPEPREIMDPASELSLSYSSCFLISSIVWTKSRTTGDSVRVVV